MARKPKTINDIYKDLLKEEQRLLLIHLEHYRNIALNLYEWDGLPEGMEGRHIEQALLLHGQCFFYDHETLGLICLPCSNSGQMNVYGNDGTVHLIEKGTTSGYFNEIQYFAQCIIQNQKVTKIKPEELESVIQILNNI